MGNVTRGKGDLLMPILIFVAVLWFGHKKRYTFWSCKCNGKGHMGLWPVPQSR